MNLSPSIQSPQRILDGGRLDVVQTLAPVRRAIGLARTARGALLGFAGGAIAGAIILVAAHVRAFDFAMPAGLLVVLVGTLAGTALGLARWPQVGEAARAADLHFSLDDRLTTALELRSADNPVAALQSRDVARRIDGLSLTRSRGRSLRRGEWIVTGLAALALAGALALGPGSRPHHAAAATSSDTQRARRAAAAQVQQLTAKLHAGLSPQQRKSVAMQRLDLALARLRRQLLQSSTRRNALRAISATQQQLRQLALGLHPINSRAVAQLNSSLSRYLGKTGATRTRSTSPSATTTAQALNRLAQSLAHLTPAQRAALARALARAANATSDMQLRSSLRQTASSLANGDRQSASSALQQAARALAQAMGSQAALSRIGSAGSQLDALKSQLSGVPGTIPSTQASGQSRQPNGGAGAQGRGRRNGRGAGAQAGQGQGRRNGFGLRQGQGRGTGFARGARPGRGSGRGQGRATGGQQGTAPGLARGQSGARGRGGRGRSALSRPGRNVTVYIPSGQRNGPQIIQNGPNGAPEPGALVPYQQVVGQYAQSAHQALDRAALPPSLQGYVRRYFSTISH